MVDKAEKEEIWRTYQKYPWIEVSNLGKVRTKDRTVMDRRERKIHIKGRVLKQWLNHGYMFVAFTTNGKHVNLLVHRLVAVCFLPNPDNLPEVNHRDNDRTNNVVSNLEWCTRQYNQDYKKNFGTSQAQLVGRPVIAVNPETSEVFWFDSQMEASRQLGVSQGNLNNVIRGWHYKTTGGYWFCNADKNAVEKVREKFGDKIAKKVKELIHQNKR